MDTQEKIEKKNKIWREYVETTLTAFARFRLEREKALERRSVIAYDKCLSQLLEDLNEAIDERNAEWAMIDTH